MKFCTNCGKQHEDGVRFCVHCGTPCQTAISETDEMLPISDVKKIEVQEQAKTVKVKKEKKPVKKGRLIAIVCAAVLVIGAAVGGFFALRWYNSAEQRLLRALKAGKYEVVLDIVDEDAALRHDENLAEKLKERIETVKADYTAGSMEYADVLMELETIEKINIKALKDSIEQTRSFANRLNASRTAFATGESFFAAGNYIEAVVQYKQVIQEDNNYAAAVAKASEAVGLYRAKVLADAEVYASVGTYSNAITVLQAALKDLPDDAQIKQQILLYEKAQSDQILVNTLAEAAQYAAGKDYLSAMDVLNRYTSINGENAQINVALNTYRDAYVDQILTDAAVYGNVGAYTSAIALLNDALQKFPGNMKLTQQIALYEQANKDKLLADALARAKAYADSGDYLSAMKVLETYTNDYGPNASVVVALNEHTDNYVDAVLVDAEGKYYAEDYVSAITILRTGLTNVPESDKLSVRLKTYSSVYVADVIAKSDALLAEREFDRALELVVSVLEVLPNHDALIAQGDKIWNAMPKNFVDVFDPYQSSGYEECPEGRTFYMSGEERTNGLIWTDYYGGYAYFNLGGNYTSLSFDVGHIDGTDMDDCNFTIYADGVKIIDITVKSGDFPRHIEVNISGVQQLKIVCGWTYHSHYGMADMIIA